MKKIFFFLIVILFSESGIAQDKTLAYREIIKSGLNSYVLDTDMVTFNAYNKGEDLNFDLECNIENVTYSEYLEIEKSKSNVFLSDISQNKMYSLMTNLISQSEIFEAMIYKCNYDFIQFKFSFKTSDYKYIKSNYYVSVKDLAKIYQNFNRQDFYDILHKS